MLCLNEEKGLTAIAMFFSIEKVSTMIRRIMKNARKYYTEHNIPIKNTDLLKSSDTSFIPITISDQPSKVSGIIIQYPNGVSVTCQFPVKLLSNCIID